MFCCFSEALVNPHRIFQNLIQTCKLIAIKSRYDNQATKLRKSLIKQEVKKFLDEGIIEPSCVVLQSSDCGKQERKT